MKKLLSAALSLVMCLTLAVPAFAARDSEIVKFQAEGIPQLYLPESDSFLLTRFSDYTDYLVDAKTGKTLYSFQANGGTMGTEFPYYDGYALVKGPYNEQVDGYSYTVVDGRGREVLFIPAGKYYQVKGVSDGMITVTREDTQDGYRVEYGFLNLKGEEVIPCQYSFAIDFSEGLAFVRKGAENQLIDKTGKVVAVVPEEASVYAATYEGFHEGMMAYDGNVYNADGSYSSKVGFLDRTGKIAIPPKYDEAEHFVNGYSVVTNFGEHSEFNVGLVDKTGREVIPCQYAGLSLSDDGKLATAAKYIDGQYRYGVLEVATGRTVIPFKYFNMRHPQQGVVSAQDFDQMRWGLLDANTGKQLLPHAYANMGYSLDGKTIWANDLNARGFMLDIATGRELDLTEKDLSVFDVYADYYIIELGMDRYGVIPQQEQPSVWAKPFIDEARQKNILPDSFEKRFKDNCSRAEFCELAVALYENQKGEISQRKTFTDTTDVNVEKMAGLGVISGVGNDRFAPKDNLTREQAAAILSNLAKALGQELPQAQPAFADNSAISGWAKGFVGQIKAADIMNGVGNNKFGPQSTYTREQCVITMVKLANR